MVVMGYVFRKESLKITAASTPMMLGEGLAPSPKAW